MKIFHVCADPGIAPDGTKGAAIHFRSIHRALSELGHNLIAFTARAPRTATAGIDVRPLSTLDTVVDGVGAPDAVLERSALGSDAGLAFARRVGALHALECNAPLHAEATAHRPDTVRPGDAELELRSIRESDIVFAVSEPLRRQLAALRAPGMPTIVVRNGCDRALFERLPLPKAATGVSAILGFLGHPKPWHGAESLVDLLRHPRLAMLAPRVLIIGGGPGAEAIRTRAAAAGVLDRLEITGDLPHSDAIAALARVSIAIAPYPRHEFFYFCPIKVIECMAAGLPVIATNQGDVAAILGGCGVLTPPDDPDALADATARLLHDTEERDRLAACAKARALSTLTWNAAAQTIELALDALRRLRESGP